MAGFISGGRLELVSSASVAAVVSTVLVCKTTLSGRSNDLSPRERGDMVHLAIDQFKDQLDCVPVHLLRLHLRGDPSFCGVRLPGSRAHIVAMSHGASVERVL